MITCLQGWNDGLEANTIRTDFLFSWKYNRNLPPPFSEVDHHVRREGNFDHFVSFVDMDRMMQPHCLDPRGQDDRLWANALVRNVRACE